MNNEEVKIVGVITKDKVEKSKTNKMIDSISNELSDNNIEHLILESHNEGIYIMIVEDAPSILKYNDKEEQWEYIIRYIEEDTENIVDMEVFVLKCNNKRVKIIDFIKILLKCGKKVE